MCIGEFLNKNEEAAEAYFDWLAKNTPQWVEHKINRSTKPKSVM